MFNKSKLILTLGEQSLLSNQSRRKTKDGQSLINPNQSRRKRMRGVPRSQYRKANLLMFGSLQVQIYHSENLPKKRRRWLHLRKHQMHGEAVNPAKVEVNLLEEIADGELLYNQRRRQTIGLLKKRKFRNHQQVTMILGVYQSLSL